MCFLICPMRATGTTNLILLHLMNKVNRSFCQIFVSIILNSPIKFFCFALRVEVLSHGLFSTSKCEV